jgi:hypothetical protein
MKDIYPFFFLSLGSFCVFLFYADVFLPIWLSVLAFTVVSLFLWSRYQYKRVGVLILLLWLVYALPFIHIFPYLWFDFATENPRVLWGLLANPYMTNESIIKLTAMIGAVGGIGFALGVSLHNKTIVRDCAVDALKKSNANTTLAVPVWMFWVITGVTLSWLVAPETTILSTAYTESASKIETANFSSAWMVSYSLLGFALCDALLDQNLSRSAFKTRVIFVAIAFVLVFLQLLRGDRAAIPFVFSSILVCFYWRPPLSHKQQITIPWRRIIVVVCALLIVSMILGATRDSAVGIQDIGQYLDLVIDLVKSGMFDVSSLLHGTWSAVLLTPLSVAGDHINNALPIKWGEDYLNFLASIPPGFMADAVGYVRPLDGLMDPSRQMTYGQGGVHAVVVPFMNFRMIGVFVIPALWAYSLTLYEKLAMKKGGVNAFASLCIIALATPHWLWYGEKNVINALLIWFILSHSYRISLSLRHRK